MLYSTFAAYNKPLATTVDEDWYDFAERLTKPVVTNSKKSVGLFSATIYGGDMRRGNTNAIEVSMLVLDFDNSWLEVVKGAPGEKTKYIKHRVADPVTPEFIAAVLDGWQFVVVTSHSHMQDGTSECQQHEQCKAGWPKFRVVMPLANPVPATDWERFAPAALAEVGLDSFVGCLDSIYKTVAQDYFWPSHPVGADDLFYCYWGVEGKVIDIPVPPKPAKSAAAKAKGSTFTAEQVSTYYSEFAPKVDQSDRTEWRGPCPLHDGEDSNFQINSETGLWTCFSRCRKPDGTPLGGDIYAFEMKRADVSFKEAKKAVHKFLGLPVDEQEVTAEEVERAIDDSEPGVDIQAFIEDLAKIGKTGDRKRLIEKLIEKHAIPEDEAEQVKEQVDEIRAEQRQKNNAAKGVAIDVYEVEQSALSYGLSLDPERYYISPHGVFKTSLVKDKRGNENLFVNYKQPISDRPIWPSAIGLDLATGEEWVQLSWVGNDERDYREWYPASVTNRREDLLNLSGLPATLGRVIGLSDYLGDAKKSVLEGFRDITSAVGWVGPANDLWYVLPGDERYEYIGRPLGSRGDVAGWAAPLHAYVGMGTQGFIGLAVLGLAACSPAVRLAKKRNPVIALVSESSMGKGTTIGYALSIWTDSDSLTVPAGSTTKGSQDITRNRPDFPIFVDEIQQALKWDTRKVEDLVYFLGNGQLRVTSSRSQTARGGDRRYGACFLAAENEVMAALQKGAQNRVVELPGHPIRDEQMARQVQAAATRNYGAVGKALAVIFNERRDEITTSIEDLAIWVHSTQPELRGDDHYVIAFVMQGLMLLEEVTGIKLPYVEVGEWLTRQVNSSRTSSMDSHESNFVSVLDTVLSAEWTGVNPDTGDKDLLKDTNGDFIAFRRSQVARPFETPLEINPSSPRIQNLLAKFGVNEHALSKIWAERGWILKQDRNFKWPRRSKEGNGARVWRITLAGLAKVGVNGQFEALMAEDADG